MNGPRVETDHYLISIGLVSDFRLESCAAHQLIGAVGTYDVVTVAGSMALKVPKKYLTPNPRLPSHRRQAGRRLFRNAATCCHLLTPDAAQGHEMSFGFKGLCAITAKSSPKSQERATSVNEPMQISTRFVGRRDGCGPVSIVEPEIGPSVALIVLVPVATPLARPFAPMTL